MGLLASASTFRRQTTTRENLKGEQWGTGPYLLYLVAMGNVKAARSQRVQILSNSLPPLSSEGEIVQAMELSSDSEINRVRTAINSLRSDCPNLAEEFRNEDFRNLIVARITDVLTLQSVTRQDLMEVGLPLGLAALLKPGGLPRPFPLFPEEPQYTQELSHSSLLRKLLHAPLF